MKELIFVVSYLLTFVISLSILIVIIVNLKKVETSRLLKIKRNLCAILSASAFVVSICLPNFSYIYILYPIITAPAFLIFSILFHIFMLIEGKEEEYEKTQSIDVEYQKLN